MSQLKTWIVFLAVLFLLLGFGSGINSVHGAEKIIKIGTLFPLTGPVASAGQRCQASVQTAVEIINNKYPDIKVPLANQEGILGGHKIVLVHADSQGNLMLVRLRQSDFSTRKAYGLLSAHTIVQ